MKHIAAARAARYPPAFGALVPLEKNLRVDTPAGRHVWSGRQAHRRADGAFCFSYRASAAQEVIKQAGFFCLLSFCVPDALSDILHLQVTVLGQIKIRLNAAKKGHQLLKKKVRFSSLARDVTIAVVTGSVTWFADEHRATRQADALTMKYRQILKRILAAKIKMGEMIKDSSFAMVQAKYVAGDGVKHTIFDAVDTAAIKARGHPAPTTPCTSRGGGQRWGHSIVDSWRGRSLPGRHLREWLI